MTEPEGPLAVIMRKLWLVSLLCSRRTSNYLLAIRRVGSYSRVNGLQPSCCIACTKDTARLQRRQWYEGALFIPSCAQL